MSGDQPRPGPHADHRVDEGGSGRPHQDHPGQPRLGRRSARDAAPGDHHPRGRRGRGGAVDQPAGHAGAGGQPRGGHGVGVHDPGQDGGAGGPGPARRRQVGPVPRGLHPGRQDRPGDAGRGQHGLDPRHRRDEGRVHQARPERGAPALRHRDELRRVGRGGGQHRARRRRQRHGERHRHAGQPDPGGGDGDGRPDAGGDHALARRQAPALPGGGDPAPAGGSGADRPVGAGHRVLGGQPDHPGAEDGGAGHPGAEVGREHADRERIKTNGGPAAIRIAPR